MTRDRAIQLSAAIAANLLSAALGTLASGTLMLGLCAMLVTSLLIGLAIHHAKAEALADERKRAASLQLAMTQKAISAPRSLLYRDERASSLLQVKPKEQPQ